MFETEMDFDNISGGEKIYAIFGFCDIKQFSEVTTVLLEDVMRFVNTIAGIVH